MKGKVLASGHVLGAFDKGLELVSDGVGQIVENGIRHELVVVILYWGRSTE